MKGRRNGNIIFLGSYWVTPCQVDQSRKLSTPHHLRFCSDFEYRFTYTKKLRFVKFQIHICSCCGSSCDKNLPFVGDAQHWIIFSLLKCLPFHSGRSDCFQNLVAGQFFCVDLENQVARSLWCMDFSLKIYQCGEKLCFRLWYFSFRRSGICVSLTQRAHTSRNCWSLRYYWMLQTWPLYLFYLMRHEALKMG